MAIPPYNTQNNSAPATAAVAVTPSDATDLTSVANALYVGGAGNINLDMPDGSTVLFYNVLAGTILPVRTRRVRSTSTTATNIIALYIS